MFRPLYPHLFDNNFVYMAWLGSLTIRQQEMCIVANIHPAALLHGLDKSHLFLGQPASPTPQGPTTNVSQPWFVRLINDVNAHLSPYQLLEVPTHTMAIHLLPGFKEAWKGSVTLRLRHRMELCVALTLLSYSWWPEMFIVRSWRCTIACHMFYTCIQFRYRLPLSAVGALVKQVHDT
jgi:hypothetical protein